MTRITAFALQGNGPWPGLELETLDAGLNVFYGPPASSKTTVADLVAHSLCSRRLWDAPDAQHRGSPEGEIVVESRGRRYRLRRSHDSAGAERLTVAALDGSPVDGSTVRQLAGGLSPLVLSRLFVVHFREVPRIEWLLAEDFTRELCAVIAPVTEYRGVGALRDPEAEMAGRPRGVDASGLALRLAAAERQLEALRRELGAVKKFLGWTMPPRRQKVAPDDSKRRSYRQPSAAIVDTPRASHFLAELSGGELVQMRLARRGRGPHVVTRGGDCVLLESVSPAERDLAYLSVCLALVAACGRRGVVLPLVLDEPFVRLDHRRTAALAAVLDRFGRNAQQVLVFTARREAAERFASIGATIHDLARLERRPAEPELTVMPATASQTKAKPGPRKRTRPVTERTTETPAVKQKRREAS